MKQLIYQLELPLNVIDIIYEYYKPVITIETVGVSYDSLNRIIIGKFDSLTYTCKYLNKRMEFFYHTNTLKPNILFLKEIEPAIRNYINDQLYNFITI